MTSKLLLAGLTAGLLLGASVGAMAAPEAPKLTHSVAVALTEAQKADQANDDTTALAAIAKAKAISDVKPYDTLMINRFSMSIHLHQKDFAAAEVDAEAAADMDPAAIPDTDKVAVYKPALQLAMNNKHYDKAVKYAKLYMALTPPPPAADQSLIVQALFFGGDYATATTMAQKNIDTAIAAGQKPSRNDLDIVMSGEVKQKDEAGAEKTLEQLVANYNTPEDWGQIMGVALTTKGMRDIDYVYMGRLMFLQNAKLSPSDAGLIGSTASKEGLYGDAMQAEKMGGTGFPSPDAKAQSDKATMQQQIAAGAKQNGQYNVKLAEALYGYGMYPEALAAAQAAKTKGGATDPSEPDMVIGMAQAASGQYAASATTFSGINQSNPASARVVRLWTYFVKAKANPAPATAAAAQ